MERENERVYFCIDLKSFFASVEAVERGLDPMKENLVVCDPSRGNGAICLAITPALKALGVKNRCRIFEIPKNIPYTVAVPRMHKYMEYAARVYEVYLRYIAKEDIHVYSIDECFLDATEYVKLYKKTPKEFARFLMDAVFKETGITATAGIGTNLFLAKVALDITAKKTPDHMGYLDEASFQKEIWHHRPITDVWNVGRGIAKRLSHMGIYDLYGVTKCPEELLYREFGVNAEFLIDHAHGVEPCTMADIWAYRSKSASLTNTQILFEDYEKEDALLVMKEMVDVLTLDLIEKRVAATGIWLYVGYSKDVAPAVTASRKLTVATNSRRKLFDAFTAVFKEKVDDIHLIRRIGVGMTGLISEDVLQADLFTDFAAEKKERAVQETVIKLKHKYGKNAVLSAMDFKEKATARLRNTLIGGHKGGQDDKA